jgi:hypothetical protein
MGYTDSSDGEYNTDLSSMGVSNGDSNVSGEYKTELSDGTISS